MMIHMENITCFLLHKSSEQTRVVVVVAHGVDSLLMTIGMEKGYPFCDTRAASS